MFRLLKKYADLCGLGLHALLFSAGVLFAAIACAQTAPQATSDATNVYYKIPYSGTPSWVRVFLDTDRNAATGYGFGGIGANYLLENGNLYRYTGTGGANWGWTAVKQVGYSSANGVANVTIARADLGSPANIDLITQTDPPTQISAKISQVLALPGPQASYDATNIYYQIPYSGTPTWVRIFLDTDRNAASGYGFGTIGANYLIENGNLYRYTGSGGSSWAWSLVKQVGSTLTNGVARITVARADLGSPSGIDAITQTDAPTQTSAKLSLSFSAASVGSRIEFYGDSTALGAIGGTNMVVARTPSMVLDDNLPPSFEVINEGVNGASIAELLAGTDGKHPAWTTVMAQSTAKYIILNHAINDSYEPGNTPTLYKSRYAQVVDIAIAAGKKVFIETPNPTNNDSQTKPYSDIAKQLALEKGIPVIDQFAYLRQYMTANGFNIYDLTNDGVHPNQATYILKGEYAAKRVKEVLGILYPLPSVVTVEYHGDSTIRAGYATKPAPVVMDENLATNFVVINEGVNSSTILKLLNGSDGVHPAWQTWVAQSKATFMIFNHGINDALTIGNTAALYKAQFSQVIDIAQAAGKKVILETPNPIVGDSRLTPYISALLQLAAERNLPVIDQHQYLANYIAANNMTVESTLIDSLHPNQTTLVLKGQYAAKRMKEILGIP
jgi:lysophospholipase L1-like esterase